MPLEQLAIKLMVPVGATVVTVALRRGGLVRVLVDTLLMPARKWAALFRQLD